MYLGMTIKFVYVDKTEKRDQTEFINSDTFSNLIRK